MGFPSCSPHLDLKMMPCFYLKLHTPDAKAWRVSVGLWCAQMRWWQQKKGNCLVQLVAGWQGTSGIAGVKLPVLIRGPIAFIHVPHLQTYQGSRSSEVHHRLAAAVTACRRSVSKGYQGILNVVQLFNSLAAGQASIKLLQSESCSGPCNKTTASMSPASRH